MGSAAAVVEIVSDDEAIADADVLEWASHLLTEDYKGIGDGFDDSAAIQKFLDSLAGEKTSAGGDDDDCIVLDGDPNKVLVVTKENRPGEDGQEEELQVVAEKGERRKMEGGGKEGWTQEEDPVAVEHRLAASPVAVIEKGTNCGGSAVSLVLASCKQEDRTRVIGWVDKL